MVISTALRSTLADACVDQVDSGAGTAVVEVRTGAAPGPDNAAGGTLLASFNLPNPAFGAAASGVATANAITGVTGAAAGTAAHFRVKNRNGTALWEGTVTATGGGGDMELNTTTISVGVDVDITSWTVTMPAS